MRTARRRWQGYGAWLRQGAELRADYREARASGDRNRIAIARRAISDHDDIRAKEGRPRR